LGHLESLLHELPDSRYDMSHSTYVATMEFHASIHSCLCLFASWRSCRGRSRPDFGLFHLTITAREAVECARAFANAAIVPVHFEGWAHFSEGRKDIAAAFADAGMEDRLRWLQPGHAVRFEL